MNRAPDKSPAPFTNFDPAEYIPIEAAVEKYPSKITLIPFIESIRKLLRKNLSQSDLKSIYTTRNRLDQLAALVALAKGNIAEAQAIRQGLKEYKDTSHKWDKKREDNEKLQATIGVGSPNKNGILNESIIWNYFVKGIKKFSQLKF